MSYKHLFIIDPFEFLHPKWDSTLRIAKALHLRGDMIFVVTVDQLAMLDHGKPASRCRHLQYSESQPLGSLSEQKQWLLLKEFDAVYMRKDPPTDESYWNATLILQQAKSQTRIFNDPMALLKFNEKMLVFEFPEFTAPALIAAHADTILEFAEAQGGDVIIKPLNLFGGRGVSRLVMSGEKTKDLQQIQALLGDPRDARPQRIVQPFNAAIFDGEIRVFSAFGRIINSCKKVPQKGSYLANTSAGATIEAYELKPAVYEAISKIAMKLNEQGVVFAGFDIIGDIISEINITSPRLLAMDLGDDLFNEIAKEIHKALKR